MKVKDLKPGDIFETIIGGTPSGNIYKLGFFNHIGKAMCWKRFKQGEVMIHKENKCRVIDPQTDIELEF